MTDDMDIDRLDANDAHLIRGLIDDIERGGIAINGIALSRTGKGFRYLVLALRHLATIAEEQHDDIHPEDEATD